MILTKEEYQKVIKYLRLYCDELQSDNTLFTYCDEKEVIQLIKILERKNRL